MDHGVNPINFTSSNIMMMMMMMMMMMISEATENLLGC